jgi:hypothetical protein
MEWVDAAPFGAGCSSPLYRAPAHVSPASGQASKKKAPTNPKDWSKPGQENSGPLMLTGGMRL